MEEHIVVDAVCASPALQLRSFLDGLRSLPRLTIVCGPQPVHVGFFEQHTPHPDYPQGSDASGTASPVLVHDDEGVVVR
jgi:hypothetical protein